MNRKLIKLLFIGATLSASAVALAGPSPQTDSFNVTATAVASCRITATSNVAFGNYDPADVNFSTPLDANGSVTVRCTKGTTFNTALDQGLNAGGGSTCIAPARRMSDGGTERLSYDLYQNAGRTTVWGCDATTDQSATSTSVTTPNTLTVYGRIPGGQDVATGIYSDTVQVTVTF